MIFGDFSCWGIFHRALLNSHHIQRQQQPRPPSGQLGWSGCHWAALCRGFLILAQSKPPTKPSQKKLRISRNSFLSRFTTSLSKPRNSLFDYWSCIGCWLLFELSFNIWLIELHDGRSEKPPPVRIVSHSETPQKQLIVSKTKKWDTSKTIDCVIRRSKGLFQEKMSRSAWLLRMSSGTIQSVKSQIAFSALKLHKINFNGRRIPHLVRNSHSPPISKTCWPCFELHLTMWPYSFFRTTCLYPLTLPLPLPSVSANTTRPHFTALPELILAPHLSLWVGFASK